MNRNKKIGLLVTFLGVIVLIFGFTLPLATYTLRGCDAVPVGNERLHLILGQTIESKVEQQNQLRDLPNVGCSATIQYTLYLF